MHAGLTATRICQLLALVLGAHLLSRHSAASAVRSRTPPAASARRTASAPAGLSALTYVVACYRLRRPESTSCAGEELSRDFYKALLREFKFRFPGNATMLRYSPKSPEEIECQGGEQCEVVSPLEWSERGGEVISVSVRVEPRDTVEGEEYHGEIGADKKHVAEPTEVSDVSRVEHETFPRLTKCVSAHHEHVHVKKKDQVEPC